VQVLWCDADDQQAGILFQSNISQNLTWTLNTLLGTCHYVRVSVSCQVWRDLFLYKISWSRDKDLFLSRHGLKPHRLHRSKPELFRDNHKHLYMGCFTRHSVLYCGTHIKFRNLRCVVQDSLCKSWCVSYDQAAILLHSNISKTNVNSKHITKHVTTVSLAGWTGLVLALAVPFIHADKLGRRLHGPMPL
jgi:hypothetical protein